MKLFTTLILVGFVLAGCNTQTPSAGDSDPLPTISINDSAVIEKDSATQTKTIVNASGKQSLVLTSNALQLVDQTSGSSKELPFGFPQEQMIETVSKVLDMKPKSRGINQECGSGPLQMATWNNGLTLVFQQKGNQTDWQFAGWYMGEPSVGFKSLTTMANIGIGSTRAEIESAYIIRVDKTSLGEEFSTASGLYGIFEGTGNDAKITSLWSGLSCNFR